MRVFGTVPDVMRVSLNPTVDIGNWNMSFEESIDVDVGIPFPLWRNVCAMILEDTGRGIKKLGWKGEQSGHWEHDPLKGDTILTLNRKRGGDFDKGDHVLTPFNRGYINVFGQS